LKNKYLLYSFLLILTAVSLNYYFATFLPEFLKILRLGFLAIVVIIGLGFSFRQGRGFVLPVKLLILAMIMSIFISFLTWDQEIPLGFLITFPYLLWPIFFILLKIKVPIEMIEKVTIIFGLIYIFCYLYQFLNPSNVMFNTGMVDDEYVESRGIIRIIFPGVGVLWLTTAIATTKLTGNDKYKLFWFILVILGLLLPIMQATRSYIVPTVLIYIYHFTKFLSWTKKIIILSVFFIASMFIGNLEIPVINGLIEQQEKTVDDGTKDIRFIAATYFATEFSPTLINQLLGNGMGHERSRYGQFLKYLNQKGLYIPDVGIIGIYAYFGVIPIIAWIIIGYKIFTYQIPNKYIYVKYYFFYIFFGALVGSTFYHVHYLITTIFALYIFQFTLEYKKYGLITKIKSLNKRDLKILKNIFRSKSIKTTDEIIN
jgi:hypothetical protein